jgi:uncharacterized protein YciI
VAPNVAGSIPVSHPNNPPRIRRRAKFSGLIALLKRIKQSSTRKRRTVKTALFVIVLLLSGTLSAPMPSALQQNRDIPKGMKPYFLGFLVKGARWAQTPPKEDLEQLLQQHLAFIRSQAEAGKYALAGPLLDDGRIRGMVIINAASAEEAESIVSGDPMVKSGRMAVEIHPAMLADVSCVLVEDHKNGGK